MENYPRPVVAPECYRELEVLAMQLLGQLPHNDIGKCLIVRDIFDNTLRRWVHNERMPAHEPLKKPVKVADVLPIRLPRDE